MKIQQVCHFRLGGSEAGAGYAITGHSAGLRPEEERAFAGAVSTLEKLPDNADSACFTMLIGSAAFMTQVRAAADQRGRSVPFAAALVLCAADYRARMAQPASLLGCAPENYLQASPAEAQMGRPAELPELDALRPDPLFAAELETVRTRCGLEGERWRTLIRGVYACLLGTADTICLGVSEPDGAAGSRLLRELACAIDTALPVGLRARLTCCTAADLPIRCRLTLALPEKCRTADAWMDLTNGESAFPEEARAMAFVDALADGAGTPETDAQLARMELFLEQTGVVPQDAWDAPRGLADGQNYLYSAAWLYAADRAAASGYDDTVMVYALNTLLGLPVLDRTLLDDVLAGLLSDAVGRGLAINEGVFANLQACYEHTASAAFRAAFELLAAARSPAELNRLLDHYFARAPQPDDAAAALRLLKAKPEISAAWPKTRWAALEQYCFAASAAGLPQAAELSSCCRDALLALDTPVLSRRLDAMVAAHRGVPADRALLSAFYGMALKRLAEAKVLSAADTLAWADGCCADGGAAADFTKKYQRYLLDCRFSPTQPQALAELQRSYAQHPERTLRLLEGAARGEADWATQNAAPAEWAALYDRFAAAVLLSAAPDAPAAELYHGMTAWQAKLPVSTACTDWYRARLRARIEADLRAAAQKARPEILARYAADVQQDAGLIAQADALYWLLFRFEEFSLSGADTYRALGAENSENGRRCLALCSAWESVRAGGPAADAACLTELFTTERYVSDAAERDAMIGRFAERTAELRGALPADLQLLRCYKNTAREPLDLHAVEKAAADGELTVTPAWRQDAGLLRRTSRGQRVLDRLLRRAEAGGAAAEETQAYSGAGAEYGDGTAAPAEHSARLNRRLGEVLGLHGGKKEPPSEEEYVLSSPAGDAGAFAGVGLSDAEPTPEQTAALQKEKRLRKNVDVAEAIANGVRVACVYYLLCLALVLLCGICGLPGITLLPLAGRIAVGAAGVLAAAAMLAGVWRVGTCKKQVTPFFAAFTAFIVLAFGYELSGSSLLQQVYLLALYAALYAALCGVTSAYAAWRLRRAHAEARRAGVTLETEQPPEADASAPKAKKTRRAADKKGAARKKGGRHGADKGRTQE